MPVIPPITIEFTTMVEQDGDTSEIGVDESRIKDFESHSYMVDNNAGEDDYEAEEDEYQVPDVTLGYSVSSPGFHIDSKHSRTPMYKEQFAYPTHLTSEPMPATQELNMLYMKDEGDGDEEEQDIGYSSGHHPSRAINASTGSDLIQVTVEDLLISEEQQRTVRSRPASSMVPQRSGSSTTMITATILRSQDHNKASASMLFEEEREDESSHQPLQQQQPQQPPKHVIVKPAEKDERQGGTKPIVASRIDQPQGESKQQRPKSQQPPPILTPAQQREAEADENIQRAIELHENNQLEEATHYFQLAAQSENPLGQLMYGLSLRHGWGCKANPNEAIIYLQRAAEYAMGELKELHPIPTRSPQPSTSQPRQREQQQHVPSSPTSLASPTISPPTSSGSGSGSGAEAGSSSAPQQQQEHNQRPETSLRRMGSLDRKAATVMARKELVMALYELGMSFLKGWGVQKDKAVAFTYFKIAADLGSSQLGNSWIWKPKYDQYCAAEISAAAAAESNTKLALNTVSGQASVPSKRFSRLKLATSPQPPPPSSSNSSAGSKEDEKKAKKKSGIRSSFMPSSSSPPGSSLPSAPSIPTPQYTVAGIAAGLASVTAATAHAIAVASGEHSNQSTTSLTSSTTQKSATSPRPPPPVPEISLSQTSTASSTSSASTPASPPLSPSVPTGTDRKRRWSLWSSKTTPPSFGSSSSVEKQPLSAQPPLPMPSS
ncbi:hypothetical protein BGZ83_006244 [Gryganskiella cystojenkinii]|nr:hypothetical protein BGZ83_006244 [Gryganskiella cystojenkinii]